MTQSSVIGKRVSQLKARLARMNLTIRDLAERSAVAPSTLSRVNFDDWNPTLSTLIKVEDAVFANKGRKP